MRYHLPENYERFTTGFTSDNDCFGRKALAETVESIISNSEGGLVIGLDAQWGAGKTSFVKMLQAEMQEHTPFIYFDAFKSDYHHDPIIALSGEIYAKAKELKLDGDEAVDAFVSVIDKVSQFSWKTSLQLLSRLVILKLVGSEGSEEISKVMEGLSNDIAGNIAGGGSNASASVKQSQLEQHEQERESLQAIKTSLEQLAQDLINTLKVNSDTEVVAKNIVFVVDELDRCRPDFAVALLEAIKHIFSASNVVFILSTNREQLEASVKGVYGEGYNASLYLEKFIHVNLTLPSFKKKHADDVQMYKYISALAKQIDINIGGSTLCCFAHIIETLNIPVREIRKILVMLGILSNSQLSGVLSSHLRGLTCLLCVLSVTDRSKFDSLLEMLRLNTGSMDEKLSQWRLQLPGVLFNETSMKPVLTIFSGTYKERDTLFNEIACMRPNWTGREKLISDIAGMISNFQNG